MQWVYMGTIASVTVVSLWVVPLDPKLIEERTQIKQGVKPWDRRLTVVCNLLNTWATAVNRFYSRFVCLQQERDHYVTSSGPYRTNGHPGHLGQII